MTSVWVAPIAALVAPLLLGAAGMGRCAEMTPYVDPDGIPGSLVIAGGGQLPEHVLQCFVELAGGRRASLVVTPTASLRAESEDAEQLLAPWQARGLASVTLMHAPQREMANDPEFLRPLRSATGVWFGGGAQSRLSQIYVNSQFEAALEALLQRGGVIGGTSAGAAIQSRVMIASGINPAEVGEGFDLLPGAVIDQHFLQRGRLPRLMGVLRQNPGLVGFGVDERTALVVQGRTLRVVGDSSVTICLAASLTRPAKTSVLRAGQIADLTALRRAALDRALPPFPPLEPDAPWVDRGSLVIGGGRTSPEVYARFIRLAGGPDQPLVVLPTATPDPLPPVTRDARLLRQLGARDVTVLAARKRCEVESESFRQALRAAKGVWFGGGRQWRFVDAYAGLAAEQLFHQVLQRGGVIGGASAGASIQAEYLVRGDPLGNANIMAEGYERGFGFLPGTAIDQHFTQRERFGDMTELIRTYPQLLGIGIDEETAIIVRGALAEVTGAGHVYFFDGSQTDEKGRPEYAALSEGEFYDLQTRRAVE